MSLKALFDQVRKEIARSPSERAKELDYPSGFEPGLRHPTSQSHVLLRDDGSIEANAGAGTSLLIDGANHQATLQGNAVALKAQDLHFHTPAGGLWFGWQRFNPQWQVGPLDTLLPPPAGQRWLWQNAPLVQNYPGALDGIIFLTGAPAPGQVPVSLAQFLHAQPLFGPNQQAQIMAQSLASLIKSLAVPDFD
jgi:hypothetical protein